LNEEKTEANLTFETGKYRDITVPNTAPGKFAEISKKTAFKMSLVIPVYHEEKLIEQNLQFYNDELRKKYGFEIIVSDGGSTDNTVKLAEKYADKVVVHTEERRQTIAEGRNRGAEVASTDTLVFINGDSVPVDAEQFFTKIEEWRQGKGKYAKADALAISVTGFPDEILFKDKVFYTLHNTYVDLLNKVGMGMGRGECQVIKKDVFDRVNGYNNDIVAGEDFDLYRRIAKVAKIKFAHDIQVYESPRRFRKYGYLKTIFYWTLNSITVMLFNKSVSKEWEAVR
jgi:glycosyltransferase involved in cell wall biosynthesis